MIHKNPDAMRQALAQALASGSQRPNPATGTMQTDGPMVQAPAVWQSAPNHPPTMLAYITPDEAALLARKDMHNSGVDEKPHFGPNGIPSFNGIDGGLGDGATSSGVDTGAGGSAVGAGGAYADVNANPGGAVGYGVGVADQSGGQIADLSPRDQSDISRGGLIAGPGEVALSGFGALGRAAGRAIDNPVTTAINTTFGLVGGPLGTLNSLSGLLGGPTLGGVATGAGRAAGAALGLNEGAPGAASAVAGRDNSGKPEGDGGPLGGSSISGGSGASGAGGPLSAPTGGNNALASALLGNSPFNQGRMTYGALAESFDPNGRRYVTPWAYRG